MTIEQLAEATKQRFDSVTARMATKEDIKDVLEAINNRFSDVAEAIDNLGEQIRDVKKSTVSVLDYVRLEQRVEVLEDRVGME